MEELSENQRNSLLNKRKEMLAKMGVPNAGTMMNESAVVNGNQGSAMAQKLAAIKKGSARAELSKYIQATGENAPGNTTFKGIPEPSRKNGSSLNKEEVKPEYKQELQNFSAPKADSSDLDFLESMFTGGDSGPARMPGSGSYSQNSEVSLGIDSNTGEMSGMKHMPTFNPQAALQNKQRKNPQPNSEYLKYAQEGTQVTEEFMPTNVPNSSLNGLTLEGLKVVIETIAKGISEKAIRNVLNEYSEQQKSKNFYEYYNKEQGVIKTSDGKLFKLTPVTIKKK